MTKGRSFKDKVRAYAIEHGMSYQAARNALIKATQHGIKVLPERCGLCPQMGGIMCLDKRLPLNLALEANKKLPPPQCCPLRKDLANG